MGVSVNLSVVRFLAEPEFRDEDNRKVCAPLIYHETYKKMNTNTILHIYQTYSLEKISALSKQSLIAQYAQNEQLVKLNKQLAANNSATNKILQNQIKELERQEKCRFYKNLIFNLKLATDKIENQPICNFKLFLSSLFLKPIEALSKESITNLEEIKDKEYAQQIVDRIEALSLSNKNYEEEYSKTAWASYILGKEAYEKNQSLSQNAISDKQKEIEKIKTLAKKKKENIDSYNKGCAGCFIFSLLFLLYITGAVIYSYYNNDPDASGGILVLFFAALIFTLTYIAKKKMAEKKTNEETPKEYEQKITQLQIEIEEITAKKQENEESYTSKTLAIKTECPDWEKQMNEIIQLLPHAKEEQSDQENFDPLFEQAARAIVSSQIGSTSMIQRMFSIGYNRAEHLMDQLEKAGIVGPAHGCKNREVLITDKQALEKIISSLK